MSITRGDNYYSRTSPIVQALKRLGPPALESFGKWVSGRYKRRMADAQKKASARKKRKVTVDVAHTEGSGQWKNASKTKRRRRPNLPLRLRVAKIEKATKASYAQHIYKSTATFQPLCAQNQCGYATGNFASKAIFEAMLAAVPIVNTAAVGTETQLDYTALTNPTKWKVQCFAELFLRNNYLFPCYATVYCCKPKVQTGSVPSSIITAGLADQANPTVSADDYFIYPSDVTLFKETYTSIMTKSFKLQPGDEVRMPWSDVLWYDQEYGDNITSTYDPKYARFCMVRISGCLSHDSTTTANIGYAAAKLDCVIYRKYILSRPSLAPLQTLYSTSGLSAMTTAIVTEDSAEQENAL